MATAGPRPQLERGFALRFFAANAVVFALAAGLGVALTYGLGRPTAASRVPPAFQFSTLLLAVGSLCLHFGLEKVRRERQAAFRMLLRAALAAGTMFVGVQSYALWWLLQVPEAGDYATGVTAFLFVIAFLHAMHFAVALLGLVYVTLQAQADRYDHEYYWGVLVCGWLWHVLGAVWLVVLGVFAIAA
jgi:heme/copper-type cytochrome/quinol oxidase subunit 3